MAAVIVIGVNVYRLQQAMDTRTFVELALIAVTGLLFFALIISGALLSLDITLPAAILRVHQVAPLLALMGTTATIYLLADGRS